MTSHSSKPVPLNGKHKLVDEGSDDEYSSSPAECGVGGFKPAILQKCANMPVFTGFNSLCALITSTLLTYVNSQVTTLERHFGFSSAQTGLIMAANDVGFLVIILFVSFIASKVHIPRALGIFTILFGVSGIICALPQFLFGAPSPTSSRGDVMGNVSNLTSTKPSGSFGGQICDGDNYTSSNCDVVMAGSSPRDQDGAPEDRARAHAGAALAIIVGGMFLQGIAKTPRSSFVTVYVDANVEKMKTGFYMGIIITLAFMGPVVAFALGGLFTRIYVTLEETNMHYRHPKWIGAWWLGYLIFGAAACVVAIPLFFFPRRIKGRKQKKEPSKAHTAGNHSSATKRLADFVKSFSAAMRRLLTNPVYMFTVMSSSSLLFSVAGGHSFTAKYIENQFAFPAWKANMSMAGVMLGTACVGTFLGGYLTKKLQMGPLTSLKFTIAMTFLATSFKVLLIFFHCPQPYLHNSPGPRAAAAVLETEGCADSCGCDDDDFFPVCGQDGRSFFSPCHAGCQQAVDGNYVNCTCIEGGGAMAGMCDYSCPMFYPFIVCLSVSSLLGTLAIIPKLIFYIRCVEDRDKSLALGFTSFMSSICGWMLGPICFGKLVDDICIQWEHSCTGTGACRLYDNDNFRMKLMGYQALFRVGALMFITLAYISARVTKKFETSPQREPKEAEAMVMVVQGKEDKHRPVAGNFSDPD